MASFYIREDNSNGVVKENKRQTKKLQNDKGQIRAPLQCITNGNGAIEKSKRINVERDCQEVENVKHNKVDLDCLKLTDKENVLSELQSHTVESACTAEDLILLDEYGQDIWMYLYMLEEKCKWPNPNYMLKQKQLTFNMRSILLDWLVTVAEEYKFQEQTLYLTVNYIDRFLSIMSVVRDKFQLLGAAAMMLAVKVEEVNILEADDFVILTGRAYTTRQITRMEQLLLRVLKFDVNPPTVINFLHQICTTFHLDKKTMYLAMYLMELTFLEGHDYMEYLPSKLAVSSVVLARFILNMSVPYFSKLRTFSGYHFDELKPIIIKLNHSFRNSSINELQAIQTKYKSENYFCIANLVPTHFDFEN